MYLMGTYIRNRNVISCRTLTSEREWLLFNANSIFFPAISWQEQVNFQWVDDEVRFVLDQHAYSWIFIVLAHSNNSPRIHMSPHSDTSFWFRKVNISTLMVFRNQRRRRFRVNQSLLFLLNVAYLADKQ